MLALLLLSLCLAQTCAGKQMLVASRPSVYRPSGFTVLEVLPHTLTEFGVAAPLHVAATARHLVAFRSHVALCGPFTAPYWHCFSVRLSDGATAQFSGLPALEFDIESVARLVNRDGFLLSGPNKVAVYKCMIDDMMCSAIGAGSISFSSQHAMLSVSPSRGSAGLIHVGLIYEANRMMFMTAFRDQLWRNALPLCILSSWEQHYAVKPELLWVHAKLHVVVPFPLVAEQLCEGHSELGTSTSGLFVVETNPPFCLTPATTQRTNYFGNFTSAIQRAAVMNDRNFGDTLYALTEDRVLMSVGEYAFHDTYTDVTFNALSVLQCELRRARLEVSRTRVYLVDGASAFLLRHNQWVPVSSNTSKVHAYYDDTIYAVSGDGWLMRDGNKMTQVALEAPVDVTQMCSTSRGDFVAVSDHSVSYFWKNAAQRWRALERGQLGCVNNGTARVLMLGANLTVTEFDSSRRTWTNIQSANYSTPPDQCSLAVIGDSVYCAGQGIFSWTRGQHSWVRWEQTGQVRVSAVAVWGRHLWLCVNGNAVQRMDTESGLLETLLENHGFGAFQALSVRDASAVHTMLVGGFFSSVSAGGSESPNLVALNVAEVGPRGELVASTRQGLSGYLVLQVAPSVAIVRTANALNEPCRYASCFSLMGFHADSGWRFVYPAQSFASWNGLVDTTSAASYAAVSLGFAAWLVGASVVLLCVWYRRRRQLAQLKYLTLPDFAAHGPETNLHALRADPSIRFLEEHEVEMLDEVLGRGGQGVVRKALLKPDMIPVAVKFVLLGEARDVALVAGEIKMLSVLKHRNIVSMYGLLKSRDSIAIVQELMDCDLGSIIGQLVHDESAQYRIALEIAYACQFLHGFHPPVLHRDLKLSNVLIKKDTGQVKLCDLGVSRQFDEHHTMTREPGTLIYLAPECLQPPFRYDESCDVFSYGLMCIELLQGFTGPYSEPCGIWPRVYASRIVNRQVMPNDVGVSIVKRCVSFEAPPRPSFDEIVYFWEHNQ